MYENITEKDFSFMYKFSYRFVDNAIVSNVETYNDSQPQDTIFCIVVGQDHIENMYNVLKSKRKYNIRYIPEWKDLEYIKTIGGRKNKKKVKLEEKFKK
jgi:DNA polymerase III delta subunit